MTDLYRLNGGAPAPLPTVAYDADGNAYTAPFAADDLAMLGYVIAPPKPDDTSTQTAEWDATSESWVMVDRPPPPPEPEPLPITLTIGDFVSRFVTPDEDDAFAEIDDAMMAESRLVRRNWQNDRYSFTEGDGFWTILRGHASAVLPVDRVAELFARLGFFASASTED